MMKNILIVDVDGTIALRNGREPFQWEFLHTDIPNTAIVQILQTLNNCGCELIYDTGRMEAHRSSTYEWILRNVAVPGELLMRSEKDFRADEIVKEELVRNSKIDLLKVLAVFDDRDRVVKMWREKFSFTCLQVADGEF